MTLGIEKYQNILTDDTCNLLIEYFENNIDQAEDLNHSHGNICCKEILLQKDTLLDNLVWEGIKTVMTNYKKQYKYFLGFQDQGYQLRKITGQTKEHIDSVTSYQYNHNGADIRTVSAIIGLNSDYENGEFHFPLQNHTTTVKRGEVIVFPVYFLYPHSVDAPSTHRYTINTWFAEIPHHEETRIVK